MKFISCLVILAWIPSVFCNGPDAQPLLDHWDYQLRDVTSRFNDVNQPVIALTYVMNAMRSPPPNQGNDEMRVRIFGQSCDNNNLVPDNIFTRPPTFVPTRTNIAVQPGERAWDLELELLPQNLRFDGSQDTFLIGDPDDFDLRLCVRTDMINLFGGANTEISFDETNVLVSIELSATLDTVSVDARADIRGVADDVNENFVRVEACQCNEANGCERSQIHPNHFVRVCVFSPDDLFEVFEIDTLTVEQEGEVGITVIQNNNPNRVFAVEYFGSDSENGRMAVVRFPGLTTFFEGKADPVPPLRINGEASMRFVSNPVQPRGNGLRQLEDSAIAGKGEFEFSVELNPTPASASKFMGVLALLSTLVSTIFLL